MVDAVTHSILGVAGQTIHYRPNQKHSKTESRSQGLRRDRESHVWGRVIEQIGHPAEDVEYVYVCDRAADNFEVFCHLQQQNSDRVIRAKAKNLGLETSAGGSITLGKQLGQITSR